MQNDIAIIRDCNARLEELRASLFNKKSLLDRKEQIKALAREHRDSLSTDEVDKNIAEVEALNTQIREAEKQEEEIRSLEEKIKEAQNRAKLEEEKRGDKNYMENNTQNVEKRSSIEYRKAFMDYIQRGVKSDILETRADAATTTSTAATVIPTTVLDEIVKVSKISGNILPKVRKMNIKGGVKVPTLSVIPTASWISEDTPSDRKSLTTGSVTFSYYGLEVKIAQTLLSEYTSIDAFEREFALLAVEAMTNAKEIAIFNGSGSGQPTGILKTTGVNETTLTAANFVKYDKLVEAVGKLPVGYRAGAEFAMASATWDKIVGMVDTAGQPVARVNYGLGETTRSLFGYPVNLVEEDRIKGIDTATADTDYIVVLGQFNKYAINSNGNLGVYKYRDEDKNQDVTKALEFLDGKVLDAKAFLRIKLAAAGK